MPRQRKKTQPVIMAFEDMAILERTQKSAGT